MSRKPLLDPNRSYTFSNYFDLSVDEIDLIAEFGYSLVRKQVKFPEYSGALNRLEDIKQLLDEIIPYIDLVNETARREMLIAPIVTELVYYTHARLSIEYPIRVNNRLQGNLDYLLRTKNNLLVIEAKQADLTRGMTQLAIELIALDEWTESTQPDLFGSVTTGNIWQFAILHREIKEIEQGLNLYRVTEDIEAVMRILLAGLISVN